MIISEDEESDDTIKVISEIKPVIHIINSLNQTFDSQKEYCQRTLQKSIFDLMHNEQQCLSLYS